MKKALTLLFVAGMFTASAQISFPTSNAVWTERHGNGEAAPGFSVIGMKTDVVTIGSYTYTKLYRSADAVLDAAEYCGGLREDALHRVYFYDAATSTERMLYDFSLVVGDTVFSPTGNTPVAIVDNIDVVVIGGVDHKRINFRLPVATTIMASTSWIEGIGNSSTGGLLGQAMAQPTCDCGTKTLCFSKDGVTQYHNGLYASLDCDDVLTTGVSQLPVTKPNNNGVSVFPNPVRSISRLQIASSQRYQTLTIYNIIGRAVQVTTLNGASEIVLDKNNFAPGVYMYRLQNEKGSVVAGKFTVE